MELGHRLKLFRVAAEMLQADVAEQIGVSKNYVYMVESGRRDPSRDYLLKFAKAVNVPLSVIFLEPAKGNNAKTRKLMEKMLTLMAEYADASGVKKGRN